MDKHERPYKCAADECEKLPGFTDPEDLLEHEREDHNKHNGPREQLNCPYPNCKRFKIIFSGPETLNDHLRRVHNDLLLNVERTDGHANEAQAAENRGDLKKQRNPGFPTRTGCLTCRRRKKKCDESRPECIVPPPNQDSIPPIKLRSWRHTLLILVQVTIAFEVVSSAQGTKPKMCLNYAPKIRVHLTI
jgi:hypothetical protein